MLERRGRKPSMLLPKGTGHRRLPRAVSAIQSGIRPEHLSLSVKARFGHLGGTQHLVHRSPSTAISSSGTPPSLLVFSVSRLPPIGKSIQYLHHAFQYLYEPFPPVCKARRRRSRNVAQRVITPRSEANKPKTRVPMSSGPH